MIQFAIQTGCCFKQHTVLCYSNEQNDREEVYQILLQMKDLVCQHTSSSIPIRQTKDASQPSIFLHKQMRRQAPVRSFIIGILLIYHV